MVMVSINPHENVERAIRRFNKKFEKSGILRDVKKNLFYVKPSENKRTRQAKAIARARREQRFANR